MSEQTETKNRPWEITEDGTGIDTGKGVFFSDYALGIVQFYNWSISKGKPKYDHIITCPKCGGNGKVWNE